MIARGPEMLSDARIRGHAVPGFTTYTLESTRAICSAAESVGLPVMIQAGASSFREVGRELLAASALASAELSSVAVGVHLDHSTDVDEIRACIELGYTSVMIDGSQLPFEENIALTAPVVEEAHAAGVWVEGELGGLAGDEDSSSGASASDLTDPAEAARFVESTGLDALAVAVGTVHGFSPHPVHVDLERLKAIAEVVPVPLVLHGASGLPDEILTAAVAAGIAKVNVNAELRRAYREAIAAGLAEADDGILPLQERAIEAMTEVARSKLLILAPGTGSDEGVPQ